MEFFRLYNKLLKVESSRLKLRHTFRNIVSWACFLLPKGRGGDLWSKGAHLPSELILSCLQPCLSPQTSREECHCGGFLPSHSNLPDMFMLIVAKVWTLSQEVLHFHCPYLYNGATFQPLTIDQILTRFSQLVSNYGSKEFCQILKK